MIHRCVVAAAYRAEEFALGVRRVLHEPLSVTTIREVIKALWSWIVRHYLFRAPKHLVEVGLRLIWIRVQRNIL